MADAVVLPDDLEFAPEPPPKGARIWLRDNMFSTPASGVMSIVSIILVILAYRGLLGFLFNPQRRWDAVTFNMKLLMVQAYPQDEMWRVWLTVGIVFALLGASFAIWRLGANTEPYIVGKVLMSMGVFMVLGGLLGPFTSGTDVATDAPGWISEGRIWWLAIGAVLLVVGYAIRAFTGERAKEAIIPVMGLVLLAMVIGVAIIWIVDVPVPGKVVDGQVITDGAEAAGVRAPQVKVFRPVSETTTMPWTVIALVSTLSYLVFRLVRGRGLDEVIKKTLTTLWVLAFPILVLVVLRKPTWDWAEGAQVHLAGFVVFAIFGSLLLWWAA